MVMGARSEDDDVYAICGDKHQKAVHAQLGVTVLPRQRRAMVRKSI